MARKSKTPTLPPLDRDKLEAAFNDGLEPLYPIFSDEFIETVENRACDHRHLEEWILPDLGKIGTEWPLPWCAVPLLAVLVLAALSSPIGCCMIGDMGFPCFGRLLWRGAGRKFARLGGGGKRRFGGIANRPGLDKRLDVGQAVLHASTHLDVAKCGIAARASPNGQSAGVGVEKFRGLLGGKKGCRNRCGHRRNLRKRAFCVNACSLRGFNI